MQNILKRLLILLLFTPLCANAQRTASNPLGAQLSVQDAGTCSTTNSFAWQMLPANAGTTTVNLAGTFSGTLTIRLSNNGGSSWTTNNTTTTAGTTTISTNGFTDVCADVTTFTSGVFQVTITTGLQQVQSVVTVQGSGGASSLNTLIDVTVAPYNVKTGIIVNDGAWTNTLFTVTSAAQANFTSAMVGWVYFGTPSCNSALTNQVPTLPRGKVASVQSATSYTGDTAATGTQASAGCLLLGPLSDAGLTLADTTATNAPDCSTFLLPQGAVFVEKPHFNTKPASCDGSKVEAQGGPEVFGWGRDISRVVVTPNFDFAGSCANGTGNVCWGGLLGMLWKDWSIFGGYNSRLGSTSNKIFIQVNTASIISDFICSGIGAYDGNLTGMDDAGGEAIFHNLVLNGCGSLAFKEEGTPSGIHKIDGASLGNSNGNAIVINTGATLHTYGIRAGGAPSGVGIVNVNSSAQWWSFGDTFDNVAATTNVAVDNNGGTAYLIGMRCDMSTTATGTCVLNDAGTPITYISNSWTKSGASGNDLSRLNGGIIDLGGNVYSTARFSNILQLTGTGACATFSASAGGPAPAASATCSGTTGAATVVLTPGTTATHFWQCTGTDITAAHLLNGTQSGFSATTCTVSFTSVTNGDNVTISAVAY